MKIFAWLMSLVPRRTTLYILTQRAGLAKVEKTLYQERLQNRRAEKIAEQRGERTKLIDLLSELHPICDELIQHGTSPNWCTWIYYPKEGELMSARSGGGGREYVLTTTPCPDVEKLGGFLRNATLQHIYLNQEGLFVHRPKESRYERVWDPTQPEVLNLTDDEIGLVTTKENFRMIDHDLRHVTKLLKVS